MRLIIAGIPANISGPCLGVHPLRLAGVRLITRGVGSGRDSGVDIAFLDLGKYCCIDCCRASNTTLPFLPKLLNRTSVSGELYDFSTCTTFSPSSRTSLRLCCHRTADNKPSLDNPKSSPQRDVFRV